MRRTDDKYGNSDGRYRDGDNGFDTQYSGGERFDGGERYETPVRDYRDGQGRDYRDEPREYDYEIPQKKKSFMQSLKEKIGGRAPAEIDNVGGVTVSKPVNFQDVRRLIDNLRNKQYVIIDIQKLRADDAERFMDFMSGATYALMGSQKKLTDSMWLFTPNGADIRHTSDIGKN